MLLDVLLDVLILVCKGKHRTRVLLAVQPEAIRTKGGQ